MNGGTDCAFIIFTPEKVITNVSEGTYGTYAEYQPSYFRQYVCDEKTEIRINKRFFTNLKKMKFDSEYYMFVESNIPNKKINFVAGGKRWEANIPTIENIKPIGIPESTVPVEDVLGVGFLPIKRENIPIVFQTRIFKNMLNLPKKRYIITKFVISVSDKTMKYEWDMDGYVERDIGIDPLKVFIPSEIYRKYSFNIEIYSNMLKCFDNEIVLTMCEKAIFITETTEDTNTMCFLAMKKVD